MFDVILAMTKEKGIGFEGGLPWHCREELGIFKKKTKGGFLIVGRKTAESLPNLPGRSVIVLSSNINQYEVGENIKCKVESIFECLPYALTIFNYNGHNDGKIFIAGGATVYNEVFENWRHYIGKVHLSVMKGEYTCDTFVNFNYMDWTVESKQEYDEFTHYVLTPSISEEKNYLELLGNVFKNGWIKEGRNGNTKSMFGKTMTFDLTNGFPLLTTKKMFFRGVVEELLFFIRGDTDSQLLLDKKIKIWDGNTNREFLDSIGKKDRREGVMGPCFPENTKILTKNGYKSIQNITINDIVFTHRGNWLPVTKLYKHVHEENMIEIKACYHPLLYCTPDHPFYAKEYIVKDRYQGKRAVAVYDKPCWIQAKDLHKKCVLGLKIEEIEEIPTIDEIILDNLDAWFMFGYFLGDGWIVEEKNGPRIHFAINDKEHDYIIEKLSKVLNIQNVKGKETDHCFVYRCYNIKYAKILRSFGKYAHGKLIPDWVHKAPLVYIKEFLNGYCWADGYVAKNRSSNNDSKRYTTISVDIAYSIQRLYLKLGYFASINFQKRSCYKKVFGDKESYLHDCFIIEVYECDTRRGNYSHISDGYAWFAISKLEDIYYHQHQHVYNFDVEEDHSYTVENFSVHNCYGYQWRNFNAPYDEEKAAPKENGIDQLKNVINLLKNNPGSRRIMMTDFNPAQVDQCVLPPCHSIILQFYVQEGFLDIFCFNRSSDLFHGLPFNIASTALFHTLIAKITGLTARKFVLSLGDAHIYESHYDVVEKQLQRIPFKFPTLKINKELKSLEDIEKLEYKDVNVVDYYAYPTLKADMVK